MPETDDGNATILLVEDERIVALHERMLLEKHGYTVRVASTGEEAVELAGNSGIDLVLMDIDLGSGMDGTEAARIIRTTHDIPITFLSSHTEPEVVKRTEGITAYGYIVKNSGETVLLASVRMALRLHSSDRRFKDLLAGIPEVAVQGYAGDGTAIFWNAASEQLYGYSAGEALGKPLWELIIPPEIAEDVRKAVSNMTQRGTPNPPETLRLMRKDGSRVYVRSNHGITQNLRGENELFCFDVPLPTEE